MKSYERPQLTSASPGPDTGPNWTRIRDAGIAILVWILIAFIVFWAAGHVVGTLIVLAIASLLSFALAPLVHYLTRWMPRALAVTVVYIAFVAVLSGFIYLVIATAVSQLVPLVTAIVGILTGKDNNTAVMHFLGAFGISTTQVQELGQHALAQAQNVVGQVGPLVANVASVLVDVVVVAVLSIYFVSNGPRVGSWLRLSIPLRYRGNTNFFLDTLDRVVGGYIRGQVTLSLLIGVLVGFGMAVFFHLPYAILLGLLAFVLEFIPFFGVLVSGATCVLVALTQGPIVAILVLAYFVGVHIIEGDVVGPRIVGSAVGLHPAVSLIALIAGAELFGIFGMLFAAPVAGMAQALAVAVWQEWRRSHPEQFPVGHTVSYDVPVVPVLDSEVDPAERRPSPRRVRQAGNAQNAHDAKAKMVDTPITRPRGKID